LGLFSLLDAILDAHMDYLMQQIPLSEDIRQALVHQTGPFFPLLQLIRIYEAGQWNELDRAIKELGLVSSNILDYYLDAVRWSGFFI
jgi:EAL and modified HD-GYP domain-containing signal transduction protein